MESEERLQSRRDFLRKLGLGAGFLLAGGQFGFTWFFDEKEGKLRAIVVDFSKCTGCRTCETVCAGFHATPVAGRNTYAPVNPYQARIRVHHFNPDADVPQVCAHCEDAPCIEACPVEPDPVSGRKALYRHPETGCPVNDPDTCIGCRSCARACQEQRTGTIRPNPTTRMPEGICDLCGGEPRCVQVCPFGALQLADAGDAGRLAGLSPDKIARILIDHYYSPQ